MEYGKAFILAIGSSFYNVSRNIAAKLPENMLMWSAGDWLYFSIVSTIALGFFAFALSCPTKRASDKGNESED